MLDTNIVAVLSLFDAAELPEASLITDVTLGELSDAPHATADPIKRARRIAVLQHVEATFDALPSDAEAARIYGQICAAVRISGRQPRGRVADLVIAAIAASNELPLYTANPKDFAGLDGMVEVVAVSRPPGATA
ncbi:type II toxin-antitoxin system VapC family toxin [Microbispora sp. CA-102843]|uniref:type II toxin-antitoxin system VapC family toxin n=1 Tax=Microbispora sp. CA-102843 TaxID=3239952 RepID=UPI003D9436A4